MQKHIGIAVLAIAAAVATPAAAQTILQPPLPEKGVWIEGTYTDFSQGGVEFPSSVWFLGGRFPVGPRLTAEVDLPFSHARIEFLDEGETSSVFGNPYVGVEYAATPAVALDFGVRLPLSSADEASFADVLAFVSDPLRAEAFAEDMIPVYGAATYTRPLSPALSLRARGGVTGIFLTDSEGEDSGTEAALDYGLSGTYATGNARLTLGFNGRWFTTEEGGFSDNSVHQLGASADVLVAGVRPGLLVRLPLDEFSDIVNSSIGLYLQVPLR